MATAVRFGGTRPREEPYSSSTRDSFSSTSTAGIRRFEKPKYNTSINLALIYFGLNSWQTGRLRTTKRGSVSEAKRLKGLQHIWHQASTLSSSQSLLSLPSAFLFPLLYTLLGVECGQSVLHVLSKVVFYSFAKIRVYFSNIHKFSVPTYICISTSRAQ